jgi:outer membrane protein assembly factor BamD (BamD/ComL family)
MLAGCGKSVNFDDLADHDLYESFTTYMKQERYVDAVKVGQTLLRTYPSSEHLKAIKVGIVSAYLQTKQYDLAIQFADRLVESQSLNQEDLEGVMYDRIKAKTLWSSHWMVTRAKWLFANTAYRNINVLSEVLDDIGAFALSYPESQHLAELSSIQEEITSGVIQHELDAAKFYANEGNQVAANLRIERIRALYPDAKIDEQSFKLS